MRHAQIQVPGTKIEVVDCIKMNTEEGADTL